MKYQGITRNKCWKKSCQKIAIKKGYCSGHYTVALHQGRFNEIGQVCSVENCKKLIYGKSLICWNHHRSQSREGSRRWEKIKQNCELKERVAKQHSDYKKRVSTNKKKVSKLNKRTRELYWQNRKKRLVSLYLSRSRLTPEQKHSRNSKSNATRHFGGWENRETVIQRDGEKCTECGMTRKEHYELFKQDLHVDHIDNNGRRVKKEAKNNNPNNLITLCVRCHARKTVLDAKKNIQRELLYGKDFTEKLKKEVRERDEHKCWECNLTKGVLGKEMDVHHLDDDKYNNKLENLLSLCPRCHWKIHHKMILETQR